MNYHKRVAHRSLVYIVLALLLAAMLSGCAAFGGSLQEVSEPASGTILSGYAPKDASQITVTLADTGSSVVMLKDTSGRTLLSFYVRAGDTVTVDVPAEWMYVHFASGTTWYGEEHLFGNKTVYRQDKELTDFTQYSWEYELDPLSSGDLEYEDTDDEPASYGAPQQAGTGYLGDLNGQWESVYLKDGNFSLNVSALAFSEPVYSCTKMTINMDVEMNAGTSCKDWQVWGRSGGSFVKLAKIYLANGSGYVSQTITFDTPVTFDAIAVTPTVVGGYSWSMGLSVTDVWVQP